MVVVIGDTEADPELVPEKEGMVVLPNDPGEAQDDALEFHVSVEDDPELIDVGLAVSDALTEAEPPTSIAGPRNAEARHAPNINAAVITARIVKGRIIMAGK